MELTINEQESRIHLQCLLLDAIGWCYNKNCHLLAQFNSVHQNHIWTDAIHYNGCRNMETFQQVKIALNLCLYTQWHFLCLLFKAKEDFPPEALPRFHALIKKIGYWYKYSQKISLWISTNRIKDHTRHMTYQYKVENEFWVI